MVPGLHNATQSSVHVAACSFLTFRYEWRYLREWIAHHRLVGVSTFAFWLDPVTVDLTHNVHEQWAATELQILSKLPGVSVFERQRGADGKLEGQLEEAAAAGDHDLVRVLEALHRELVAVIEPWKERMLALQSQIKALKS